MLRRCAADGCESTGSLRCSRCKKTYYCSHSCQRSSWKSHKSVCVVLAASLSLGSAQPFEKALDVPTKGAAGWTHFVVDGRDYLAVANFFTSRPGARPSMTTESVVYEAFSDAPGKLRLEKLQAFATTGAHGVEFVATADDRWLVVPNYYGGDTVVLKWAGETFVEHQRLAVDGGGNVVTFKIGDASFLSVAEFNKGVVQIYALRGDRWALWQAVRAPGCGATTTAVVDGRLYLIAASYVTRETGWRTRSRVFALNAAETAFESHHDLPTVGAHGVATLEHGGRHWLFFSNDKDERSPRQDSELFVWTNGRYASAQKVRTDGAHAAELFAAGGTAYLAVANLGDRGGSYRRDSSVYELDAAAEKPLRLVQSLPTLGATDFKAFTISGTTFLAVSNEQDDRLGGDVDSTIWALSGGRAAPKEEL